MTRTIFSPSDVSAHYYSANDDAKADFMFAAADKLQKALLAGDKRNHVYSPICLYLCAYILAQTAKGSCRNQIFEFLEADETFADKLHNLVINNNYTGDEYVNNICLVGTSLWINDRLKYSEELLKKLCNLFNTASFGVDVSAKDAAKKMNAWITKMTRGLLNRENESSINEYGALTILSTVYINAGWDDKFFEEDTRKGVFYAEDGKVDCQYMRGTETGEVFYGKIFSAYKKYAGENGVWFILPEKGCTVEDVLFDGSYLQMIQDPEAVTYKEAEVTLRVPKFDISNEYDMVKMLCSLGITDIFDSQICDISELIKSDEKMYVDKFTHSVRMEINENGIEAAALAECTVVCGCAPYEPAEKIRFDIDRPFLFAVTGADNSVLMSGVVNDPTK